MLNFASYTAAVLDMDGTLYRGQTALPGVNELLQFFDAHNIAYACATNNSTLTPAQYEDKLRQMGLHVPADRVITSSTVTRRYLEARAPRGTRVLPIGMQGLREALFGDGYFTLDEHEPEYVVVGMDVDATYKHFRAAALAIRAGATFIGTNPDRTLPTEAGLLPGTGSLLALLQTATDVAPEVMGKPAPTMMQVSVDLLGTDAAHALAIGDRLDTDIAGAQAANMATALVLTGVSSQADVDAGSIKPDGVYKDLPALLQAWQAAL